MEEVATLAAPREGVKTITGTLVGKELHAHLLSLRLGAGFVLTVVLSCRDP